ncbi:MAG: VOC family protein [Terriglobales bacterium]
MCQIAISCLDQVRTCRWYQRALGFVPAGALPDVRGPEVSAIQGLPDVVTSVTWLLDQQNQVQMEFFAFQHPSVRPIPPDWKPSDVGFSMIGIHVANFDRALDSTLRSGGRPLSGPIGPAGKRRVCLRDPEGVLLELMEDDPRVPGAAARPRPHLPVAVRSMTLSVPDLARARRFWVDTLGLPEAKGLMLHGSEHEALWGLSGARRKSLLLWAGDFLIELVQYTDPLGRPRPAGYWLADQGISHIAVRPDTKSDFDKAYQCAINGGYRGNCEPVDLGGVKAVYMNDDQGFTVELLWCDEKEEKNFGFQPADTPSPMAAAAY